MNDSLHDAALVLKSLPKSEAAKIMSKLDVEDVRAVMQQSDKIGNRSQDDVQSALKRLSIQASALRHVSNTDEQVHLRADPPQSTNPLHRHKQASNPFQFLVNLPSDVQVELLQDQQLEEIALVTTYLPTEVSAPMLKLMESSLQMSVLRRLCHPVISDQEQVAQLVVSLRNRLEIKLDQIETTSVQSAAQPQHCDNSQSQTEALNCDGPVEPTELDEQLALLRFEDLKDFEDLDIQTVLKAANTSWWAPALKNSSRGVREKILVNMAGKVSVLLTAEIAKIQVLDNARSSYSQSKIVEICIQLAKQGKIKLPRKF